MSILHFIITPVFPLLLLFTKCFPQNFLLLSQKGIHYNRIIYKKDDIIHFRLRDEDYWIAGKIDSIGNDFIAVDIRKGSDIKINDIAALKTLRTGFNYKANGMQLMVGGITWANIALINGLINKNKPLITGESIVTSAGIVLTGLFINSLAVKVHHIGGRKVLRII